jgi:hypothetical protein
LLTSSVSGCGNTQPETGEDAWRRETANIVRQSLATTTGDASTRTLFVPAGGQPDPYLVASALIALGPDGLGGLDEDVQAAIVAGLDRPYTLDDLQNSTVGALYLAAQLLEADAVHAFLSQERSQMLAGVVEQAVLSPSAYADHTDAAVALDALRAAGHDDAAAVRAITSWSGEVATIVCASSTTALDHWIAVSVEELELPCTGSPDRARWLRDTETALARLENGGAVDVVTCQEVRWISRAGEQFDGDDEIQRMQERVLDAAAASDRFARLEDPLVCAASLAQAARDAGVEIEPDADLQTYLAEVAERGGEPARLTLASYVFTRLVLIDSSVSGVDSLDERMLTVDERVLLKAAYASSALEAPAGSDWPAVVREAPDVTALLHLLEASLMSGGSLCAAAEGAELTDHAIDRADLSDGTGLLLASMALRVESECDAPKDRAEVKSEILTRVDHLRGLSETERSLGSSWTLAALTCLLDPGRSADVIPGWARLREYVNPGGGVFTGGIFDPMETYYVQSLSTASAAECASSGLLRGATG